MNYNSYRRLIKNKYALSTVVTTLIILVISVLLASVVTYFAINVVSTRVQEESLTLTKQHIWLNPEASPGDADYSIATLMVINTGGRDIVIDKLAIRGQEAPWDNEDGKFVLYTDPISADFSFETTFEQTPSSGDNQVTFGSTTYQLAVAENDLVLPSGCSMIIYIINPDSITINDIGLTVSITLYTAQAMYYRESNVQAYAEASESV